MSFTLRFLANLFQQYQTVNKPQTSLVNVRFLKRIFCKLLPIKRSTTTSLRVRTALPYLKDIGSRRYHVPIILFNADHEMATGIS